MYHQVSARSNYGTSRQNLSTVEKGASMSDRRPQPFQLINTKHGPLVVNQNDHVLLENGTKGYGVSFQLMTKGEYDAEELKITLEILQRRLNGYGPGMV